MGDGGIVYLISLPSPTYLPQEVYLDLLITRGHQASLEK